MEEAPPGVLEDPLEVRLSTGTAAALQERARRCSRIPRRSNGRQLTASRFVGITRSRLTVYQPRGGSLMSRINHQLNAGVAVSLTLAAVAPARDRRAR